MMSVDLLRGLGCERIALASTTSADPAAWKADGHLGMGEYGDYDGVVILDSLAQFMRRLHPMQARGAVIIPADPDMVVSSDLRVADAMSTAWNYSATANYVARCGLRGHYVEFGTFWGRSFYNNYFQTRHWLSGEFYAFDSFQGLSVPLAEETKFTAGDFQEGEYFCNLPSFQAIGALLGVDEGRIRSVPGFFSETLLSCNGATYRIADRSVSVCIIDCDLFEPTTQVLDFVSPLLDEGALIYFDDWRLCRASSKVGERAAALAWLAKNPDYELIELPTDPTHSVASWQGQWFIFQRR
jgi:Macrocin-O-methyltransferase (TylF)